MGQEAGVRPAPGAGGFGPGSCTDLGVASASRPSWVSGCVCVWWGLFSHGIWRDRVHLDEEGSGAGPG